jgi:hypothetical protein
LKNLKKHITPRHDHTPSPHTFDHSDENVHKRHKEAYIKEEETQSTTQQMTKLSQKNVFRASLHHHQRPKIQN